MSGSGWENALRPLLEAGRVAEAAGVLDRHLLVHPNDVAALRQQGRILLALGQAEPAVGLFHRAAQLLPGMADVLFELGVAQLAAADLDGAAINLSTAAERDPDNADCWFNLGWLRRRQGDNHAAAAHLRRAVALRHFWPAAWFNLGNAQAEAGQLADATQALRCAVEQAPGSVDASTNLGLVLWRQGELAEAETVLRRVVETAAAPVAAITGLASVLAGSGRGEAAVALLESHGGRGGEVLTALGSLLLAMRRRGEARAVLSRAVENAATAESWNALGGVQLGDGALEDAQQAFNQALLLRPDFPEAINNLGNLAALRGDADAALSHYRRAHQLAPERAEIHSNLLFLQAHRNVLAAQDLFAEHQRFGVVQEALADPIDLLPPAGGKIRIGYVSPDFCNHAVAFWFEGVLANHDRQTFAIHCYHCGFRNDVVTSRLRGYGDIWRFIGGLPADAAARIIRDDNIDILIDLAGHSAENALPVFVRHPARIQATWLGYPFTTGLTRMDYRLTDIHTDPEGLADTVHTERLARLPLAPVFRPPTDAPDCGDPPFLRRGHIRFGSFNKPQKITPQVVDIWAEVLHRCPRSDLQLMLPGGDDPSVLQRVRNEYAARGIASERIFTCGLSDLAGFLDQVRQVDIALDPFPYGGGTTTILTLWMGVPLICMGGDGSAAGVSYGMLGAVLLHDLRAADGADYVEIAHRLAQSPQRLTELRGQLRHRVRQSCTMQEKDYVASLEAQYRLWLQR